MSMWRRQDEPKVPVSSPEIAPPPPPPPPRVEPPAEPLASAPPPQPAALAGHLTISHTIRGEISGREDLFVDGEVEGKIHLQDAKIVIGPNGRVTADIEAREIMVLGRVKGNLHGHDSVTIGRTGNVAGDVATRYITIEDGAQVQGSFDVTRAEETRVTSITEKAKSQYAG